MGGVTSTTSAPAEKSQDAASTESVARGDSNRFSSLQSSGRYATYTTASGATIHVIGALPASSVSAEEVYDLVTATKPKFIYIDDFPEVVAALREDAAAGRVGNAFSPSETPRSYRYIPDAGVVGSVIVRNKQVENELFALMGAELYAPYKAALVAGKDPVSAAGDASILSYPFSLGYNNYEVMERPSHFLGQIEGDNLAQSTVLTGHIQNAWITAGGGSSLVSVEARVPPERGYLTRKEVSDLQLRNQIRVDSAARLLEASSEKADNEAAILALEGTCTSNGDEASRVAFMQAGVLSQRQSQAVAFALQQAGEALPRGASGVAVVNLGSMASLQRNWHEAKPPHEAIPPHSPLAVNAGYGGTAAAGGLLLYGLYRAGRRFPKTTVGLTLLTGSFATAAVFGMIYSEATIYGQTVRSALARPRITSPQGRPGARL